MHWNTEKEAIVLRKAHNFHFYFYFYFHFFTSETKNMTCY